MGRPKGSRNLPKIFLPPQVVAPGTKLTPAKKMNLMRRQVALMVAAGMTEETIAEIRGISMTELRSVFSRELRLGRELVLTEELQRLDAASSKGNIAASKQILSAAGADQSQGDATTKRNDAVKKAAVRMLRGAKQS